MKLNKRQIRYQNNFLIKQNKTKQSLSFFSFSFPKLFYPLRFKRRLIQFILKTSGKITGNTSLNAVNFGLGLHSQPLTHHLVTGNNR